MQVRQQDGVEQNPARLPCDCLPAGGRYLSACTWRPCRKPLLTGPRSWAPLCVQYYLTGLSVNEMTSSDWSEEVPGTGQTIGALALQSRWVTAVGAALGMPLGRRVCCSWRTGLEGGPFGWRRMAGSWLACASLARRKQLPTHSCRCALAPLDCAAASSSRTTMCGWPSLCGASPPAASTLVSAGCRSQHRLQRAPHGGVFGHR